MSTADGAYRAFTIDGFAEQSPFPPTDWLHQASEEHAERVFHQFERVIAITAVEHRWRLFLIPVDEPVRFDTERGSVRLEGPGFASQLGDRPAGLPVDWAPIVDGVAVPWPDLDAPGEPNTHWGASEIVDQRPRMTWRYVVHNLVAHPFLVLCPPFGEWLHAKVPES